MSDNPFGAFDERPSIKNKNAEVYQPAPDDTEFEEEGDKGTFQAEPNGEAPK